MCSFLCFIFGKQDLIETTLNMRKFLNFSLFPIGNKMMSHSNFFGVAGGVEVFHRATATDTELEAKVYLTPRCKLCQLSVE